MTKEQEIADDIRRVGKSLVKKHGDYFSRSEYLNNGAQFSHYDLYDGGTSWKYYCEKVGFRPKEKDYIPDEVYFERLIRASHELGRFPKTSERKKFGLNFQKRRWPSLKAFIETAISRGIVAPLDSEKSEPILEEPQSRDDESHREEHDEIVRSSCPIPPIPEKTKRKKWERTGIVGFPYAPQDESGVVALFSVLCANGIIPWQILDLNSGKGTDAVVYDEQTHTELRVELKHTLSKSNWNHSVDSLDYVVCWENRWHDFPKPVYELKNLVKR